MLKYSCGEPYGSFSSVFKYQWNDILVFYLDTSGQNGFPLKKKKVFIYFIYLFILNRKALEDLGIPCFLGGMSRGLLGKDSPIHIRQNRRDALKEADVVVLAGQANIVSFLFQNDKKRNNILRPTYLILILYSKENYAG